MRSLWAWFSGIAVFVAAINRFFQYALTSLRERWEPSLQHSDRLLSWWVLVVLLVVVENLLLLGAIALMLSKHIKHPIRPDVPALTRSILLDFLMTVFLWCAGTVLSDDLILNKLSGIGLRYFPDVFFATGCLWLFVALFRVSNTRSFVVQT